jgi:hypothetical protein
MRVDVLVVPQKVVVISKLRTRWVGVIERKGLYIRAVSGFLRTTRRRYVIAYREVPVLRPPIVHHVTKLGAFIHGAFSRPPCLTRGDVARCVRVCRDLVSKGISIKKSDGIHEPVLDGAVRRPPADRSVAKKSTRVEAQFTF